MQKYITGIQQVGIGVSDVHEAFRWYRKNFGMDIKIFEEDNEVTLMLPYTGGKIWKRHAILAMNLNGGGGVEIWQYKSRTPQKASSEIQLGDLGIFCSKMKTTDVVGTFEKFKEKKLNLVSEVVKDPSGNSHFFVKDPYGNLFQYVNENSWFGKDKYMQGGAAGITIGVTDIDKAKKLYSDILGYDEVVYDKEGVFEDLQTLSGGNNKIRRVLLKHKNIRSGGFSRLFGSTKIELIKVLERVPIKNYENRFWGDLGFIHVCFDVTGMSTLRDECKEAGFAFRVDSANSFDMGEAAGHFSYIEDADGTLIEFVETHKVPVLKKLGIYINLRKRDPRKNIPNWIVRALAMRRVKD
ncbi:MAG: VOC family protein [Bacteroidetes bacterium]|nr:VOC family protein [Bacteroidota bacterium]